MLNDIDYIRFYLSGGSGNTAVGASLGGAISTTEILSQAYTATLPSGLSIIKAHSNSVGVGTLFYDSVADTLAWKDAVGSVGIPVDVSVAGDYSLKAANGIATVLVSVGVIASASLEYAVTVSNLLNKAFVNVGGQEHFAGVNRYACFYVKNTHPSKSLDALLWIGAQPNAGNNETIYIGFDPIGIGGHPVLLADPRTAPSGVTFSAPSTVENALPITLNPGQYHAWWQRRKTLPKTQASLQTITSAIAYGVSNA